MRCLALAGVAVLVLSSHAPGRDSRSRSAQDQGAGIWTGVERIVAVGDVHGDYDQLVAVLRSAGLIDEQGNWTGGKTHLVQNGDVLDRGPDSRHAMDLLMRLEKQAAEAGGYVHALIGNHEALNVYGDLRYTSAGEFAAFRDENSEKSREAALAKERPADRASWEAQHPLGYFEHRQQFSPGGYYGKWIASHDAVIKINDSLFVHAGISAKYVSAKIRDINQRVREELKDPARLTGGMVTDPDGPLWYRGLAEGDASLTPLVEKIQKTFGVERIVLGHTYADAAITPRFGGKVILIDIGLSRAYDGIGKMGCLVIEKGSPFVLHRGKRLELPADSAKDLLRYLKEAAALDPPPSPLLKRIGELESKMAAN
jgi:Calcineurin-like phosphoesterase